MRTDNAPGCTDRHDPSHITHTVAPAIGQRQQITPPSDDSRPHRMQL
jgi:hypothetical protein